MDTSQESEKIDMKSFRRRSVIRRLWESYAVDLITILQAANDGKCSQRDVQETMSDLIPSMKQLRDGGAFEKLLHKADLVILDKVFNDVTVTEAMEPDHGISELDFSSEDL